MTNAPDARARLADLMDQRRRDLRLTWDQVASRAGIHRETLRQIRSGTSDTIRPLSRAGLEDALEWERGSIETTLCGGVPAPDADVSMNNKEGWRLLSTAVRNRRDQCGWTQLDIAARGGPSIDRIQAIEAARTDRYSARTFAKLEHALDWEPGSCRAILDGGNSTQRRSPAQTSHAYLVLLNDGQVFSGHLDRQRASQKARTVEGLVVEVPIVEDYRAASTS